MAKTLKFAIEPVVKLAQHAMAAPERTFGYDVLFEPKHHKGGKVKEVDGWPDKANIDMATIGPALLLVKDQGVYLMSAGVGEPSPGVTYARESDPNNMDFDDWYSAAREIMGGDDTVITLFGLPQAILDSAVQGAEFLEVSVTQTSLSMGFTFPGPDEEQEQPSSPSVGLH
ncbi:MAG: hypothetical protein K0Q43_4 [Ramlibacter sp.]|jgi:hypothetical protein|nr:hypothetical protein [Ramlibacter sp.]